MKPLKLLFTTLSLVTLTTCMAQIKNARTVTVRIDGDCGMCETTIEKVGFAKNEAAVDWDTDTKLAQVTYDSTRTDLDAILHRVALAGYDNERFLAPEGAYKKLPGCCQYDRTLTHAAVATQTHDAPDAEHQHQPAEPTAAVALVQNEKSDHLKPVFDAYFSLKDALVASDAAAAMTNATALADAVHAVQMERMTPEVHGVWMQVMEPLANIAQTIASTKDLDAQRTHFAELADPMRSLVKVAPRPVPVYYDHCPMFKGGADWLSQQQAIKNPFYGSMMLGCGSVQETIQ